MNKFFYTIMQFRRGVKCTNKILEGGLVQKYEISFLFYLTPSSLLHIVLLHGEEKRIHLIKLTTLSQNSSITFNTFFIINRIKSFASGQYY